MLQHPGITITDSVPRPLVLTYHILVKKPSRYVYSISCEQFDRHLTEIVNQSRFGSEPPLVTFDDGNVSDYELALPLLQLHGIQATFFVTAGHIGREAASMSWKQVREISSLGHSVQAHSWSHMLLTRATESQLCYELEWSRKTLEDKLGLAVREMSLPGGRCNRTVLNACEKAGYLRIYDSNPWKPIQLCGDAQVIGRFMVRRKMSARNLRSLMQRKMVYVFWLRAQHEAKKVLKRVIGDGKYHDMWRSLRQFTEHRDRNSLKCGVDGELPPVPDFKK